MTFTTSRIAVFILLAFLEWHVYLKPASQQPSGAPQVDPLRQEQEDQVRFILQQMPLYEQDRLAEYESQELRDVQADIDEMFNPRSSHSFTENFASLESDWERLVARDLVLQKQSLI